MIFRHLSGTAVVGFLYLISLPVLIGSLRRIQFVFDVHADLSTVDARYAAHPWLTVLHLAPGIVFFVIGPLQFSRRLRRIKGLHRWLGRLFITVALLSGFGVLWMVLVFPALGGLLTQVSTFGIIAGQVLCLGIGWRAIRRRKSVLHRAYMIRAFALGLSVSTARIVIETVGAFWHLPFDQTFVPASIIGVALNVVFAELVILYGPGAPKRAGLRQHWV